MPIFLFLLLHVAVSWRTFNFDQNPQRINISSEVCGLWEVNLEYFHGPELSVTLKKPRENTNETLNWNFTLLTIDPKTLSPSRIESLFYSASTRNWILIDWVVHLTIEDKNLIIHQQSLKFSFITRKIVLSSEFNANWIPYPLQLFVQNKTASLFYLSQPHTLQIATFQLGESFLISNRIVTRTISEWLDGFQLIAFGKKQIFAIWQEIDYSWQEAIIDLASNATRLFPVTFPSIGFANCLRFQDRVNFGFVCTMSQQKGKIEYYLILGFSNPVLIGAYREQSAVLVSVLMRDQQVTLIGQDFEHEQEGKIQYFYETWDPIASIQVKNRTYFLELDTTKSAMKLASNFETGETHVLLYDYDVPEPNLSIGILLKAESLQILRS